MSDSVVEYLTIVALALFLYYLVFQYIKIEVINYKKKADAQILELLEVNEILESRVVQRTEELKEATDKLKALEGTDNLTDIHNRYSIMKRLDVEVDRAKRYQTPLAVFMYDLDHFKRVSDTHGHRVGDDILYNVTKVVKESLRDIDIVGKYGEEEFLVIMPSTTLTDAVEITQRVCENVSNHKFSRVTQVTISVGLVELRSDDTMDMLFTRADRLLYKSKDSGRNRVSF